MIKCLLPLVLVAFAMTSHAQVASPQKKWKLVWQEEFNGHKLDTATWNYEVNDNGGGNNELQYYTNRDTNAYLENGLLHIRALHENYRTRHYTSARITTKNKAGFTFGKIEVRAKIPTGRGMWPAIWMMPTDEVFGDWPMSGEIDIMETKGQEPDTLYGTMHFGPLPPANRHKGAKAVHAAPQGWGDDFHVYGIVWQRDTITWLADGRRYFQASRKDVTNIKNVPYPFNEKFYFILNLAIGGAFAGDPDDQILPNEFLIDYIKVWK